jgi:hypothetical protein
MDIVERLEEIIDRHRTAGDIGDLVVIRAGRRAIVTYEGQITFRVQRLNECRGWLEADGLQVRAVDFPERIGWTESTGRRDSDGDRVGSHKSAHLVVAQPE